MELRSLKNIFAPESPATSYCTVVGRLSTIRYEVEDANGRKKFVESAAFYPPGVGVVVKDGRITGRGMPSGKHRYYEV